MTYDETIEYLYNSAPLFQNIGASAYKEGLSNTKALDEHFGHPHTKYKTIHIAGTNGKGSCAHTIASILQEAGYKVGLYTSPHLVDFRERIRVNGEMIPRDAVVRFVEQERAFFEPLHPSFFELTTALAFSYFEQAGVDVAVIEVGLGGRLDCTNIIAPELAVITNISFDHTQFLGNTLSKIAGEKAGIIKRDTPVVIGEYTSETRSVFADKAREMCAPIFFAQDEALVTSSRADAENGGRIYQTAFFDAPLRGDLAGEYQERNMNTVLCAALRLREKGFAITEQHIRNGVANVCRNTGLQGRWQIFSKHPLVILDTGHNAGGLIYNMRQLAELDARHTRIVVGMVSDKDVDGSLALMPERAEYYFTKATVKRALNENELLQKAATHGLHGRAFPTVGEAAIAAINDADEKDVVYIGGSNFVVGDFLAYAAEHKADTGKDKS